MAESKYIHKSHNVSVLLYHVVCTAKYRRVVFSEPVDEVVREVWLEIAQRYEIRFLEIGAARNPMHFLIHGTDVQSNEDRTDGEKSDRSASVCPCARGQEA